MAIVVKKSVSDGEIVENPIKKGWRKIVGTTNSITIPKEAYYARIVFKGTLSSASQSAGVFFTATNKNGTAYNRRALLSNNPGLTEQTLTGSSIIQLLPAGDYSLGSTINLWIEFQYRTGGNTIFGKYSSHATGTFDSRIGTVEYYRQSANSDHGYALARTGSTVSGARWIAEYITEEDFESLK